MSTRLVFAGVGLLAILAGLAGYFGTREPRPVAGPVAIPADVSPAVLLSTRFTDAQGAPRSLAEFPGRIVVVNFWATWCAPCREEMPGFTRLQAAWKDRGIQFVGVSDEEPAKVQRFGRDLGINYPLWVGGSEVMALSRRLGNSRGVLPHTVILDGQGNVLDSRIGLFSENVLEQRLLAIASKTR
jgi:thiol-disulfide isomerase/thioredoxin